MLGHLVLADDLADPDPDRAGIEESSGVHGGGDLGQVGVGGLKQRGAFAGAFVGQGRVAAGHQAFVGVVRVADLGQVGLVEQAHLQRAVVGGQGGDRRGPQRGDPADAAEFAQGLDPGVGDHPGVADHHHVAQGERVPDGLDDVGEGGRVGGVAGEDPDRDRAPGRVGQQPVLDLRPFLPSRE